VTLIRSNYFLITEIFIQYWHAASPIETIVNGILHRPYGKSLSRRLLNNLFRRFLDDATCTNKAALGVMAMKKQDLSIDTNFEQFCENWIDPMEK
jgi:hypothetical protein